MYLKTFSCFQNTLVYIYDCVVLRVQFDEMLSSFISNSNSAAPTSYYLTHHYFYKEPVHLSQANGNAFLFSSAPCSMLITTLIIIHLCMSLAWYLTLIQ